MAKPKFSWQEQVDGRLRLKILDGDREISWKLGARPTHASVVKVCRELLAELERGADMVITAKREAKQSPEVPVDEQMTEEGSAELRAAKAKAVEKTGRTWFSNMDEDDVLPLYDIGHGEVEH